MTFKRMLGGGQTWAINVNGVTIGRVRRHDSALTRCEAVGWYFWLGAPLPHVNTCDVPLASVDEAKAAAKAYVLTHWRGKHG